MPLRRARFAMAFSNVLAQGGTPPERLEIDTVHVRRRQRQGLQHGLDIRARVPGIDEEGFQDAVAQAEQGCPRSNALAGQRGGPSERQPEG